MWFSILLVGFPALVWLAWFLWDEFGIGVRVMLPVLTESEVDAAWDELSATEPVERPFTGADVLMEEIGHAVQELPLAEDERTGSRGGRAGLQQMPGGVHD